MKKKTTKLNAKKPAPTTTYTFTGDREALVAKLRELKNAGKIKVVQIAQATGVKSSSASCWIQEPHKSLPKQEKIEALVNLINSVN